MGVITPFITCMGPILWGRVGLEFCFFAFFFDGRPLTCHIEES